MITSQFVDYKRLAYRLYAVFMHQGSAEFGHYYIYIFDFKKGVWRKYNDNDVTEVQNSAEIFENSDQPSPPTPYFLVYVNDTMKDRLVEAVCRQIVEAPHVSHVENHSTHITSSDPMATSDRDTVTTAEDVDMDPPPYRKSSSAQIATGLKIDLVAMRY